MFKSLVPLHKMRSSSSNSFSFLHIVCSIIYLLSRIRNADGFSPLIQLPTNVLYRNSSSSSSTALLLNIDDFGAKGNGYTDDTKSFEDVWKVACSWPFGATIRIPKAKSYVLRPTNFIGPCKSKVTFRVSGFISAPRDPAVYNGLDEQKWLYFYRVNRLKIEGGGLIDGMGHEWWARSCNTNLLQPCTLAPTALSFHKCKNLRVRNITLFNGPQMHMAFTRCTRVAASGVSILSPAGSPNTGGIHVSSSTRVELKENIIFSGDDCVSIVGNSSGIRIKNILCGSGRGISIGSLGKYNSSDASIEDVIISGSAFFNTQNGVKIQSSQGDSGYVRKVAFENILMDNVSNPIVIDQYHCESPETALNQSSAVRVEGISFRGIIGTSATDEAIRFACSDRYSCKRMYLENIRLVTTTGTDTNSFCWEAYGMSSGTVYPPSCISSGDIIIRHQVESNSSNWLTDRYALF